MAGGMEASSKPGVNYTETNDKLFDSYIPVRDLVHIKLANPSFEISGEDALSVERGLQSYEALIVENLGIVHWVVNRLDVPQDKKEDLVQAGTVGLIFAVRNFDPNLGYEFSTFATSKVKPSVYEAAQQELRVVKLPAEVRRDLRILSRTFRELQQQHGHNPSLADLIEASGMSEKKVNFLERLKYQLRKISLDAPRYEDQEETFGDSLVDTSDDYSSMRIHKIIAEGLRELSERDREIVSRRLGLAEEEVPDLRSLGEKFEITYEAVRKIQNKGLELLRRKLGEEFDIVASLQRGANTLQAKARPTLRRDQASINVAATDFKEKFNQLPEKQQQVTLSLFDMETGEQRCSAAEVAEELGLSPRSVSTYASRIRNLLS